jgi:hypothetical protein
MARSANTRRDVGGGVYPVAIHLLRADLLFWKVSRSGPSPVPIMNPCSTALALQHHKPVFPSFDAIKHDVVTTQTSHHTNVNTFERECPERDRRLLLSGLAAAFPDCSLRENERRLGVYEDAPGVRPGRLTVCSQPGLAFLVPDGFGRGSDSGGFGRNSWTPEMESDNPALSGARPCRAAA